MLEMKQRYERLLGFQPKVERLHSPAEWGSKKDRCVERQPECSSTALKQATIVKVVWPGEVIEEGTHEGMMQVTEELGFGFEYIFDAVQPKKADSETVQLVVEKKENEASL